MEFVGDLSEQDARVLVELGRCSSRIIEFGVGGSTQLFAQCMPKVLISVETDLNWVRRLEHCLELIKGPKTYPVFVEYNDHPKSVEYDLVFVDGIDSLRAVFARSLWPLLTSSGIMVFHDTRREHDFSNVLGLVREYWNEVRSVEFNVSSSNISVVRKGSCVHYEYWLGQEGKPGWAYGQGEGYVGELWPLDLGK